EPEQRGRAPEADEADVARVLHHELAERSPADHRARHVLHRRLGQRIDRREVARQLYRLHAGPELLADGGEVVAAPREVDAQEVLGRVAAVGVGLGGRERHPALGEGYGPEPGHVLHYAHAPEALAIRLERLAERGPVAEEAAARGRAYHRHETGVRD